MSSRRRNLFVILLMLGFMVGSVAIIVTKETKLGLDLKGGVELVYQGEPTPQSEVTPEAIDRAIDIMRERVDRLGVAEPEIQRLGNDQISVGLPGVKNLERAKNQVGTTAQLQLYDWEANVVGSPTAPINSLYSAVKRASQRPPQIDDNNTTKGQYYLFRANKTLAAGPDSSRKELLSEYDGRVPKGFEVLQVPPGTVVLKAERPENLPNDAPFERYFVVRDNPELRGTDIKDPRQESDPTTGEPIVTFRFTDQGRKNFQEVTRRLAERGQTRQVPGQPVESSFQTFAIVLDRELVSRPFIDYRENPDGIDGRTGAQISGGFKLQEAQDLADVLKTGALPIDLKPISETQVSASLGKQALREGLLAGAVGFGLVLIFLMLFYRLLGVIASFALVTYAVLFYGMIKLIPITLTLPGIAGLILTIGIAADSNIVIFERIKEELRAGRSSLSAIATGYKRGIATIIDANVVTLITAFILFVLATAGVKGFAFTLGVGTLVSLFTAVLFTQAVLSTMGRSKLLRSPAMLGAGERHYEWKFDFMGNSKWFFAMSGTILIIGSLAVATKQLNFGIDFESGTRVTASLERDATVEGVRDTISPLGLDDAKIQEVREPGARRSRRPDLDLRARPRRGAAGGAAARPGVRSLQRGPVERVRGTDVRRNGGAQRRVRDRRFSAPDHGLRRAAVRAEVRDPGHDRPVPRPADHGRRVLAHGPGGDDVDRGGDPDDPRLFALRRRDRVRPNTRERAAHAAGGVLADREPFHERRPDPVAGDVDVNPDGGCGDPPVRGRDAEGLRVRAAGRNRFRDLLVDLHRGTGTHGVEGARTRFQAAPPAHRGRPGLRARVRRDSRHRASRRAGARAAAWTRRRGGGCRARSGARVTGRDDAPRTRGWSRWRERCTYIWPR